MDLGDTMWKTDRYRSTNMILYGHRGAKGEAPENTLTGFAYARSIGIRDFEFDVRLTADHELIVLHDATVDRTTNTNERRATANLNYAEIAPLDARAEFFDWPQPCGIPILAEVLTGITDRAHMEIEIKRDEPERLEILVAKMVKLLETLPEKERVTVTSFDPTALAIMRRVAPHFSRGYIGAYDTPAFLETAINLECRQAGIPLMTGSKEVVHEAQKNGLRVTGWPGDSLEQLQTLVDWGVENITTNYPSIAIPFLRERSMFEE